MLMEIKSASLTQIMSTQNFEQSEEPNSLLALLALLYEEIKGSNPPSPLLWLSKYQPKKKKKKNTLSKI